MIRNIKEIFLPKTGMWKNSFLQDPGHVKDACCMMQEPTAVLVIVVIDVEDVYELQCKF